MNFALLHSTQLFFVIFTTSLVLFLPFAPTRFPLIPYSFLPSFYIFYIKNADGKEENAVYGRGEAALS